MTYPNKQQGLSILELLLVLSLSAALLVFSLNRYHQYKQNEFLQAVRHDVGLIFQAVSHYYYAQTCTTVDGVPGVFPYVNENLMSKLSDPYLTAHDLANPSQISHYEVQVVDSLQRTKSAKPLYLWQVIAYFKSNEHLNQYQKLLEANSIDLETSSLKWILPVNANSIQTSLWILNTHLSRFKAQQTAQDDSCA